MPKKNRICWFTLLSPQGQIELTNYRTVKVPSDKEIPEFVQLEFRDFYQSMFQTSYERENKQVALSRIRLGYE